MRKLLSCIFLFCVGIGFAQAQSDDIYEKYNIYRNPIRLFLNNFSWTITTGFGGTTYKHDLEGFYFAQDPFGQYISSAVNQGALFDGYQGWVSGNLTQGVINADDIFNTPYGPISNPINNEGLGRSVFGPIDADSAELSFKSVAPTVPIMAQVHYNFQKFRIGLGFQYERHYINPLKPSVLANTIRPYEPSFKKSSYTKIYGLLGYEIYEWWDYTFALELQLGRAKAGKQINTDALAIGQNFYANVGVNIEQNLSEYFRVVVRPGMDFKSYVINIPDDQASSIRHNNMSFIINVGISINIPEIPRSPMKSDHVQLKHVIMDPKSGRLKEVRGQPLWKVQNPKVGQNHRRLWRYKWKNRRKIHPY